MCERTGIPNPLNHQAATTGAHVTLALTSTVLPKQHVSDGGNLADCVKVSGETMLPDTVVPTRTGTSLHYDRLEE